MLARLLPANLSAIHYIFIKQSLDFMNFDFTTLIKEGNKFEFLHVPKTEFEFIEIGLKY